MTKQGWIIFAVLCIGVLGGLIWVSQNNKVDVSNVDLATIQPASEESGNIAEHTFGNSDSKVILFEYADYQCPGCASAYPVVKEVVETYKEQIGFVFRNFPLTSIHPNALAAASAAEAAGLQGKFWEYHDKLYENQQAWSSLSGQDRTAYFTKLAGELSLDETQFSTDVESNAVKKKVDFDQALGKKAGVTGTPSLFINGKNVGELYVLDGKIVDKNTEGAEVVWSDADAFGKLVIEPALKENNIPLPEEK